jgi:membrane-bound ClpP family serine protease
MSLRRQASLWERTVLRFGISPWSSLALVIYGVAWVTAEGLRGKGIGWDGVITLVLGEIALASLRAINRRDAEKEVPDEDA